MNKVKIILDFFEKNYRNSIKHFSRNSDVFKILISTVLSQRTRDENTDKAVNQLFSVAKTPRQILKLPMTKLRKLIKPSGMYRQKAKRIKEISKIILKKYRGKVPRNRGELMDLPGVGYKTSAIVLMYGFNKPAIAVDVHVEVCSKRLGLVSEDAKPKEIEAELEKLIPINKWYLVNLGFVIFGKEVCLTRNPKCNICPLLKICPYGLSYGVKRFQK